VSYKGGAPGFVRIGGDDSPLPTRRSPRPGLAFLDEDLLPADCERVAAVGTLAKDEYDANVMNNKG